jgi:NAD(P)-dependent dehydrogenase (short-subunit alcohol dehydrogenase family)
MTDRSSLAGRVAVVTGAAGLLGRRHACALAGAGAALALGDVDAGAAAAHTGEVADAYGVATLGLELDVTSRESLLAFREAVLGRFGRIDVLVNDAAVNDKFEDPALATDLSRFEAYPLEAWRRMMEVNVTGTFLACQVLGAAMAERGSGSIVNVASTYGLVAPDQSLYVRPDGTRAFWKSPSYPAGKGAVLAFTRYLAAYWGARGVRVNALSPGGVEDGQESWFVGNYAKRTPLGRMAAPDDTAGAILFLASDASSYVTGANLVVDGGFTAW